MICRICGKDKSTDNFSKQPRNKSGYLYQCKECVNRHYLKNPPRKTVDVKRGRILCKTCGRSLPKSMMIKQYGNSTSKYQARCKDCDNLRKQSPDVWRKKDIAEIFAIVSKVHKMKPRNVQITLSPGVKTNFSCDELLWTMLPHEKRGDAQKFIRTSIVELHQAHFSHMRLTLQEYLQDLCEKYKTKPASVIATAVAWHTGKHSII